MGLLLVFQPCSGGKSEKSPNCIAFWRSPFLSVWWRSPWHFIGSTAVIYSFSFFLFLKYISNICDSLDIDECKTNLCSCHVNADCLNTIGSYVCRCHTGYIGDGTNCDGNSIVSFYFFWNVIKITTILELWHVEFKSDDKNSYRVTIHFCLLRGILWKKYTHKQILASDGFSFVTFLFRNHWIIIISPPRTAVNFHL